MQAPRTMRSTGAPARPARSSASISPGSVSALILATMRAGRPGQRGLGGLLDVAQHALVQHERRRHQVARRLQPAWLASCRNTASASAVMPASAVR
jgi:hypothetical protein